MNIAIKNCIICKSQLRISPGKKTCFYYCPTRDPELDAQSKSPKSYSHYIVDFEGGITQIIVGGGFYVTNSVSLKKTLVYKKDNRQNPIIELPLLIFRETDNQEKFLKRINMFLPFM